MADDRTTVQPAAAAGAPVAGGRAPAAPPPAPPAGAAGPPGGGAGAAAAAPARPAGVAPEQASTLSAQTRNRILFGIFVAFLVLYPILDRGLGLGRLGSMNPILIYT